jgi:FAD binding domain
VSRTPHGRNLQLPTVTVIGAGIAGLTTAHELVERGFPVQIVEAAEDEFVEYACAVGGLAANQFARARLAIQDLHPWLLEREEKENLARVEKYRNATLDQTARRFPIKETLRFDKRTHGPQGPTAGDIPWYDKVEPTKYEPPGAIPTDWQNYWDRHGVYNRNKFNRMFETIRDATAFYTALYLPNLWQRLAFGPEMQFPADWISGEVLRQLAWPAEDAKQDTKHAKLAQRFAARETFVIHIIGYTDGDGSAEANRATAFEWAYKVGKALIDLNNSLEPDKQIFNLEDRLEIEVVGDQDPAYDQKDALGRNLSNRVEFAIVEQVLPGEHGFRFFPAFYRNLFDTMRRTPIFGEKDKVLCTAFDQLNATPHPAIAAGLGGQPKDVASGISSVWQSNQMLKLLRNDLGFQLSDLFGLEYYMLRFLTSCSARREKEAEPINLLQYIGGHDPSRRFSKAALDFLTHAPRALAAMSATESDARTQLDVTAQLVSVNSLGQLPEHMTLNGPTSKAWLDHWKVYLKNQGVEFFVGRITSLEEIKDRYVPVWQKIDGCHKITEPVPEDPDHRFKAPCTDGSDIEQHRFVLALSYQKATDLLWNYADDVMSADSAFRQLLEFDVHGGRRKPGNKGLIPVQRDPLTGAEPADYPLRTISGAQMFFPGNYRFGEGNVYFARTPWDLTSISQLSYWTDRDSLGEFRGQISVDVGAWHEFASRRGVKAAKEDHGNAAWYSSADEIAAEIWAEVLSGFETSFGGVVQAPLCFHIDRNLVFSEVQKIETCRSALIRIILQNADFDGDIKQLLSVDVRPTPGSNVRPPRRPAGPAVGAMTLSNIIASLINKTWPSVQAIGLASSDDGSVPQDVLISPRAFGRRFIVEFSAISENSFFLSCARPDEEVVVHEFSIRERSARAQALLQNLPAEIEIQPLDEDNRAFLLKASVDMVLWVSNADGAVEIANGPVQQIAVMSHALRFFSGRIGGVGNVASGAVRANALVTIGTADKNVVNPFVPLRDYGLAVGVGVGEPIYGKSENGDTPEEVRDRFFDWLTTTDAKRLVIAQRVRNDTGYGIVISPVTLQRSALIRVLPAWSKQDAPNFSDDATQQGTFTIKIGADHTDVSGVGLTVTQIRDTIIERLEAAHKHTIVLEAVGEDSLLVTRAAGSNPMSHRPLSLAVLNVDARIEVVGAPALIIKARGMYLKAPPQGFVVMRNEAEFLINIYDQWRLRPGLRRDPSGIPKSYRQLSADFGDKDTEIYYGTSRECRLLEHWTPAGTYMATYARITTMEAANESGRHAAAAILYKLLASGRKDPSGQPIGLVGNFPMIWRIEDYEPDDLRFAKELDDGLIAANLPHALDIIGVTELVNSILASTVNDKPLLTEAIGLIRAALGQPHQTTMANLKTLADRLMVLTRFKGFGG